MKKCKSNMSEAFKRKSALHYALGGEVVRPPSSPAAQGVLAQPLAQRARLLDDPEAAATAALPAAPAPGLTVPNLTNQEMSSLGKNPVGTAPPTLWGAFKDRYGMGPSGYAHGGMVLPHRGEPSKMDLGAAAVPGLDNPLRRNYQTGGEVPPRPQLTVAPPSITAPPPAPVAPPNVRVTPGFDPAKGGYHYEMPSNPPIGRIPPSTVPFTYQNPMPDKPVAGVVRGSKGGPITDPGKGFPARQGEDKHHIVVAAGEYVLPNRTVDALGGVSALDKIVEATNGSPPNNLTGSNALRQFYGGGGIGDFGSKRGITPGSAMPITDNYGNLVRGAATPKSTVPPLNMEAAARSRAADMAAAVSASDEAAAARAAQAGPMVSDAAMKEGIAGAKTPTPNTVAGKAGAAVKSAGEKVAGAVKSLAPSSLAGKAVGAVSKVALPVAAGAAAYKTAGETTQEIAERLGFNDQSKYAPEPTNDLVQFGKDYLTRWAGFADNFLLNAPSGFASALRKGSGAPQAQASKAASPGGISPEEAKRGDVRTPPPAPPPDWSRTGQRNPNPLRVTSTIGEDTSHRSGVLDPVKGTVYSRDDVQGPGAPVKQVTITDGSTPEQMRAAEDFMHARAAERIRQERYADARDRATNPRYDPANIAAEHAAIEAKYRGPAQTPGTILTSDGREVPIQSIEGKLIAGAQNRRMLAESALRTTAINAETQRRGQDLLFETGAQNRASDQLVANQRALREQFNKDRDYSAGRSDRAFEQDEKRITAYNKMLDDTFLSKGPKGEELGREKRVRANELIMGTLQEAGIDPRDVSQQDFTEMARLAALDMATEQNREGVTGQLKTWVLGPFAKARGLQGRRGPVQINKGALVDTVTLPDGRVMTRREYELGSPGWPISGEVPHQRELEEVAEGYRRLRDR